MNQATVDHLILTASVKCLCYSRLADCLWEKRDYGFMFKRAGIDDGAERENGVVIGILAHVDAGKTTLSEAMLYVSGSIRRMGRVDNKDAFLDTYELERSRGITIFSKQAVFPLGDRVVTLLDTPGHVDFSAEMERTLQVLDYAVLVISGADGVQGHTLVLWRLLKKYRIPVFLFINKMDQDRADKGTLMAGLKKRLSGDCIDFTKEQSREGQQEFYENIAMAEEEVLDTFLKQGIVTEEEIRRLIAERKVFPCFFGSALKAEGVGEFLAGLECYTERREYPEEFGAKVFKITRDHQGNRLTFLKVTGGTLKARAILSGGKEGDGWEEKVNQIRIYSGEKYRVADEAGAGSVCAVTGLSHTKPGQGLGAEKESPLPLLEPVLAYRLKLPPDCDPAMLFPKLRLLEEEEPQLHLVWDETQKEIRVKIMGEVQTEVLKSLIMDRFGVAVGFGMGSILYKETIGAAVEGVGHFEPLKHYAEVHLLLEPGEAGSGLVFASDCGRDMLEGNWQNLVLSHLEEKEHKGVLTGAPITDMKITLIGGRAHQKHTEGGDFRQACYRALRQGLMEAPSILLEPYYDFRLEVPEKMIGRAMTDMEKMNGTFSMPVLEGETAVLTGYAPVDSMRDYPKEVAAYTKGHGRLLCTFHGYGNCHNAEEVIRQAGYDPDRDMENPSGSVFCAHGAGFFVEWNKVKEYMHVESCFPGPAYGTEDVPPGAAGIDEAANGSFGEGKKKKGDKGDEAARWLGTEEVDAILARTSYANRKEKKAPEKRRIGNRGTDSGKRETFAGADGPIPAHARLYGQGKAIDIKKTGKKEKYLLVDGYNIIFAWEDLRKLAETSIDGARGRLMDILCNYQGIKKCELILVFDAYRVQGHITELFDYHNIHVVYTKEAETADQYIEKFAHENGRKADVTVATSDGLEQIIIRGQGCALISARELKEEVERTSEEACAAYERKQEGGRNYLPDMAAKGAKKLLDQIGKG